MSEEHPDTEASDSRVSPGLLSEVPLKLEYETGDDLVSEFYIPCLSRATRYDRAAGYFTSGSLSLAARGIQDFIQNEGSMRLICSYEFDERDLKVLRDCTTPEEAEEVVEAALLEELSSTEFASELAEDRFKCLAWMLEQGYLEIRIAYMPDTDTGDASIYHEKLGIFEDGEKNRIAFSGSINETAKGWQGNFESFDVFRSWGSEEQEQRVELKEGRFERLWTDKHPNVIVRALPEAVEIGLCDRSPGTKDGLPDLPVFQDPEFEYSQQGDTNPTTAKKDEITLWKHQRQAIQWWKDHDFRGILAMATGTGKTWTALRAARLGADTRLTVIVVPKKVLLNQWREDLQTVFPEDTQILECSGRTDWKREISMVVDPYRAAPEQKLRKRPPTVLLTTPHTGGSKAFRMAVQGIDSHRLQLIADEVHNYGAPTFQRIFEIDAGRRIGLSATPERQWDQEGTETIFRYFGGHDPFEFKTVDAIENGYLSEYEYHPVICDLAPDEYEDYAELSTKIEQLSAQLQSSTSQSASALDRFERLLRDRAKIKKRARAKPERFGQLLDEGVPTPAIIFCEDTVQLEAIEKELDKRYPDSYGVYVSARENEQGQALYDFREGHCQYLLAINCLDEGLDVPDAKSAVIISSDANKRQFIQRRGRVLRLSDQKEHAVIYDLLVLPGVSAEYGSDRSFNLIKQELRRAKILMAHATNKNQAERQLGEALESYGEMFPALAYVDFDDEAVN
ncbi:DEAD/DEAH box helicase family protein [Halomicrococcus sp. NG-SE-24]|uniref:DEAD/DEAH box helicase family protein n=1 Tax=Halomicrococcus sp. NG-SE-24 TaxID=3436928 RepID=UPI003D97F2AE